MLHRKVLRRVLQRRTCHFFPVAGPTAALRYVSSSIRCAEGQITLSSSPRSCSGSPTSSISPTAGQLVSARLQSEGAIVAARFGDGAVHKYHSVWLRDHCRCSACTHGTTLQRLADTFAIPQGIKPQGVQVIEDGAALRVCWTDEGGTGESNGHDSVFSSSWLAAHVYTPSGQANDSTGGVSEARGVLTLADGDSFPGLAQSRLHEDPASVNASSVTPWTALHFGPRDASDADRHFPAVPYGSYMGLAQEEEFDALLEQVPAYQAASARISAAASQDTSAKRLVGLHRALSLLHRYGFVRIEGVPVSEKATEQVCKRIGGLMSTLYSYETDKVIAGDDGSETTLSRHMWRTEVLPDGGNDTAFTGIALPAHTDGCYMQDVPGLQVFHALKADAGNGGDSLLVDGFSIAEHLRKHHPDTFDFLSHAELPYHHTDPEHILYAQHSVIQVDRATGQVTGLRFNNDDRAPLVFGGNAGLASTVEVPAGAAGPDTTAVCPFCGKAAVGASSSRGPGLLGFACGKCSGGASSAPLSLHMPTVYLHLRRLIEAIRLPHHELWMPLRPGTVLIFNNQRVMHGRASFSVKSGRVLSGCYLAADTWKSRLRSVSSKLGLYTPAIALK